jgi:hypothetical protein
VYSVAVTETGQDDGQTRSKTSQAVAKDHSPYTQYKMKLI